MNTLKHYETSEYGRPVNFPQNREAKEGLAGTQFTEDDIIEFEYGKKPPVEAAPAIRQYIENLEGAVNFIQSQNPAAHGNEAFFNQKVLNLNDRISRLRKVLQSLEQGQRPERVQ